MQEMIEKNAEYWNLGGMMGDISDFKRCVQLAHEFGTNTIMVSIDNDRFEIPDMSLLNGKKFVIHGPLSINMAAEKDDVLERTRDRLIKIISKCNQFSEHIETMVLHPGNASNDERLIETLRTLLPLSKFPIALETMGGQGRELGRTMESLVEIREKLDNPWNLKFCVDTCHVFAAGYDMRDAEEIIERICNTLGVENIACFHINDSMRGCGEHRDAHAHIGEGRIPVETLRAIVQCEMFREIPKILETPKVADGMWERYDYTNDMRILLE